ncbi:MAG: coniferyl aldehyde dehydrogenase [Rubrivivax sp.]|nr:coniferyl aldehyde dehydrogenase [Rubrivivax sp.]
MSDTATADLRPTLDRLRTAWQRRRPDARQRLDDLARLRSAFKAGNDDMLRAIAADFGHRSVHESLVADSMTVLAEIDHLRRYLRGWMKPRRVGAGWKLWPARALLRPEPVGVVGVMSPWNYPVNLALIPLATAIAAGNHAYLKPSEHTPQTSAWLQKLLTEVFPDDRVAVALGGADVAAAFAALPFDHLLFTGSSQTGRLVMAAAAQNLCPVTLELGGKAPAVVCNDFPVRTAAERILYVKCLNAGQICTSVDHMYLPRKKVDAFVSHAREIMPRRYPSLESVDYTSVIDERSFRRLVGALDDARERGVPVVPLIPGPAYDAATRKIAPHIVLNPPDDSQLMQREIFGPILPILPYDDLDAVIARINAGPRPLALYPFSRNDATVERLLTHVMSGGVSVNDALLHVGQHDLPFGGVGESGMGHYHGKEGFETFSKLRPIFRQARWSSAKLLVPPYGRSINRLLGFLMR